MPNATVTSKGQVTIPKPIREALELEPGDRVAFRIDGEGRVVLEAETVDLMGLYSTVKPTVRGVTIEDMARAVRTRGGAR